MKLTVFFIPFTTCLLQSQNHHSYQGKMLQTNHATVYHHIAGPLVSPSIKRSDNHKYRYSIINL